MNERDVQRISELLARFSMYTQQFKEEEKNHAKQQPGKTLITSELPKPHAVLQQGSTSSTCVLSLIPTYPRQISFCRNGGM